MSPVGYSVLGERDTTPTVPRVGRAGMETSAGRPGGSTRQSAPAVPWGNDRSPSRHGTHPGAGGAGFLLAWDASRREPDLQRVRLCNVEETQGTAGAAPPIRHRGSDGTIGHGRRRTLPCHFGREPVLPYGGVLLLEMARVLLDPGPEGHDRR